MVATSYITELDFEKLWATGDLETTRFVMIGVRMAELLNMVVHGDAATNVTDTKILPFLEQFSEELLLNLYAASKIKTLTNPWDFIQANVLSFFIKKYKENLILFDMIRKIGGYTESIEVVKMRGFGASGDI